MSLVTEFLLERVVHHSLKADPRSGREAIAEALTGGASAESLLVEVLWPAMECAERLREDATIPLRVYNGAVRSLRALLETVERRLSRDPSNGRSVFVFTVPGESSDLGADMIATLAESRGWLVFFAGAGLSLEEVTFSMGRLEPDVMLMHGNFARSGREIRRMSRDLRRAGVRPSTQLVVAGGMAERGNLQWSVDLVGRAPMETLELMALWPDYRAKPDASSCEEQGLTFPQGRADQAGLDPEMIRRMILRHLNNRIEDLN